MHTHTHNNTRTDAGGCNPKFYDKCLKLCALLLVFIQYLKIQSSPQKLEYNTHFLKTEMFQASVQASEATAYRLGPKIYKVRI